METAYSDKNEKICVLLYMTTLMHIVLEKPLLIIKT